MRGLLSETLVRTSCTEGVLSPAKLFAWCTRGTVGRNEAFVFNEVCFMVGVERTPLRVAAPSFTRLFRSPLAGAI